MIAMFLALLATGQAAPALPNRTGTLQARFDAASEAAAAGRCAEAVAAFEEVEAASASRRNPLLRAAIDVRKGECLVRLHRAVEGEAAIRRGLPGLSADQAEFANDLRNAHLALAAAAQARLDYDAAARESRAAVDISQGTLRVVPLLRLSQMTMFDHDGRALAAAQEARTLALGTAGFSRKDIAAVQTQYARVLLNEGRQQEAYRELKDSLAKQGGLGSRVGVSDIATRSDLAIAALQNRDMDGARLYLAYTGAGRMHETPFGKAAVMDPPVCGGEAGLKPEDHAIVEFTLEEDGRVSNVIPIYTTGRRPAALAFARAVGEWSWRAADVKDVPLLFRSVARVEVRCVKSPEQPELTGPLRDAVATWLAGKVTAEPAWADLSAAAALPLQRASLSKAQGVDQAATLQATLALAESPVTPREETAAYLGIATAAATALDAPVAVRTYVAVRLAESDADGRPEARRRRLRALLAGTDIANDPLSAATLRLLIARPMNKAVPPTDAAALLDAVIGEPQLSQRHPLKVAAMLGKANVLAAGNDLPAARAVFERTGLSAEQCALVGLQPAVKRSGASSADYPMAAVRLGFEGWVRTEYDISADGRTVAPRVVTAYPPFVFDDAATGIVRDTRYTSTFRPAGALACAGEQQSILFRLP